MPAHTFHGLSDVDFQDLVADLLGAALETRFQPFAPGRDLGIDLLSGPELQGGVVVQCKHYWRSGLGKLQARLRNSELPKLAAIKPSRYLLATSVPLTPANKQSLCDLLTPYCRGVDDIYGRDDLNALLRQFPRIEQAHHKLWLTSVALLQKILRHGTTVWNALQRADIERTLALYVNTSAFAEASQLLSRHHYCIISGIPGIGKTTLAQVLLATLLDDGYELVAVHDNLHNALQSIDLSRKQALYYDDFLGRASFGERMLRNEDHVLVRLLLEARRTDHFKVLLTTREYILKDAQASHEVLAHGSLDVSKCILTLSAYSRTQRARILYNHVYFAGLGEDYCSALAAARAYLRIIDHTHFSPRIIEWMTLGEGLADVEPARFADAIVAKLDNPTRIWEHAFDHQLGDDARALLLVLAVCDAHRKLPRVHALWTVAVGLVSAGRDADVLTGRFLAALKRLDGSFVRTAKVGGAIHAFYHNPSIESFVRQRVANDAGVTRHLLRCALEFEQVSALVRMNRSGELVGTPAGLVEYDQLCEAVERTVASRSISAVGHRLSELAQWSNAHAQYRGLLDLACGLAHRAPLTEQLSEWASTACIGFVDAILQRWPPEGQQWNGMCRRIIKAMCDEMATCDDYETWRAWGHFVTEHRGMFDAAVCDDLRDAFEDLYRVEIDSIVHDVRDVDEARERLRQVERAADVWGVSMLHKKERASEHIRSLEAARAPPAPWRGSPTYVREGKGSSSGESNVSRLDGVSEGAHIERLFQSLRHRHDD